MKALHAKAPGYCSVSLEVTVGSSGGGLRAPCNVSARGEQPARAAPAVPIWVFLAVPGLQSLSMCRTWSSLML